MRALTDITDEGHYACAHACIYSYFDERHGSENSCPSEGEALKEVAGEGVGGVGG